MEGSKRYLLYLTLKVAALVLTAVGSYLALLVICLQYASDGRGYLSAELDKMELLRRTPSPRLVLVGGSNLAFGVDSGVLSAAIGLPVINMGLHAGLGLKYMLDCAAPLLRNGDIVVVVPEFEHFTGDLFDGQEELVEMVGIKRDPSMLWRLSPSRLLKANIAIFNWKPGGPAEFASDRNRFSYTRDGFNRDGDEVSHLGFASVPISSYIMDSNLNRRAVNYLATFIEEQKRSGVTTIFLFPSLMKTNYQVNQATISRVADELKKQIPQARSTAPNEFVFDDQYFFDLPYHLNAEGRKQRTDRMVEVLKRLIREGPVEFGPSSGPLGFKSGSRGTVAR